MRGVVSLQNILPPIMQLSIANQKSIATIGEIELMILLNAIRHEHHARAVLLAIPLRASHPHTLLEGGINFGVSNRFGFAVVPSPAPECAHVRSTVLLQVGAEALFARNVSLRSRHIRS